MTTQDLREKEELRKIEEANYASFRDCWSTLLIEKLSTETSKKGKRVRNNRAGRKTAIKPVANGTKEDDEGSASELAEFVDYFATEVFESLPAELRTLTYSTYLNTPSLHNIYSIPLPDHTASQLLNIVPVSVTDTLSTYLSDPATETNNILTKALSVYIEQLIAPPPPPSLTKDAANGCELCGRSWIPITYHHLIPRGVHEKVLKRGWHTADMLNNVAWLCRACHSYIHRVATNEELAREYYTVERLEEREDVVAFTKWVAGVRWKAR